MLHRLFQLLDGVVGIGGLPHLHGDGQDLVVVDDQGAAGLQQLQPAQGLDLLKGHHHVGLAVGDDGGVHGVAILDHAVDAAAPLGQAVLLGFFHVEAQVHQALNEDIRGQNGALTAHAHNGDGSRVGHITRPPSQWHRRGRSAGRWCTRCSPRRKWTRRFHPPSGRGRRSC